jgi:hypothetical protein
VQGFNLLNCLYQVGDISVPVAFELIRKPLEYYDLKTRKRKRACLVTKNELMRTMLKVCAKNKLKFRLLQTMVMRKTKSRPPTNSPVWATRSRLEQNI